MENMTVFENRHAILLLIYKISSPICFLLNILAIYLIVFKSTREMKNYRWHLLNYQIWTASIDIFLNVLFQPVIFLPVVAITGRGVLITNLGFSTFTCASISANLLCGLSASIVELFFYRHQCIVNKLTNKQFYFCIFAHFFVLSCFVNGFLIVSHVDSSQWSEAVKKWNPTAMYVLKIPNIYYIPYCKIAITAPVMFILAPIIFSCVYIYDGRLDLQILNDVVMVLISNYGILATLFLIYFNDPYREFLIGGNTFRTYIYFKRGQEDGAKQPQNRGGGKAQLSDALP
uniref:7TM_GPCR_Srx domain-containing protein n=1 Tax=Heterorhabditis bacteriophora TaxID=37862 RepID=A0A1I7XDV6_HETBA